MRLIGVLKETAKVVKGYVADTLKIELADTTVCENYEKAEALAWQMWDSLCDHDKKRTIISVISRELPDEEFDDNYCEEVYFCSKEKGKEIALSENYNKILEISYQGSFINDVRNGRDNYDEEEA